MFRYRSDIFLLCFVGFVLTTSTMSIILRTIKSSNTSTSASSKAESVTTILVHGLDSSSRTWQDTMDNLQTPCVAIDQRGCGYTPLGDPSEFSQASLIEDLNQVILKERTKVVLLGHSLGGRVVLGYAATYPEKIAALIIEDMDIAERTPKNGLVQLKSYTGCFDRRRDTKEELTQALIDVGYPVDWVQNALGKGRIEPTDKNVQLEEDDDADPSASSVAAKDGWWSHVNPDFRKLCYQHVLSTSKAKEDCRIIANYYSKGYHEFPCHILVAGEEGTICKEESIQEMKSILGDQATIHRYPQAGHSIHSTAKEEYLKTIQKIIHVATTKMSARKN